jgi:hypothetical protein
MLQKESQSLCNFSFLKIVKIEPANKVQSIFSERDPFSARKTSLFISFTSLIGMEWTFPWTYLTWHNFLFFYKKIFEEFFCAARTALKWKEFLWSPLWSWWWLWRIPGLMCLVLWLHHYDLGVGWVAKLPRDWLSPNMQCLLLIGGGILNSTSKEHGWP